MVAEWNEYERWLNWKKQSMKTAAIVLIVSTLVSIGIRIVEPTSPSVALVLLVLYVPTSIAMIWAAVKVLDLKGRSRWFWVIGFLVLALEDRNRREPPQKPGSGVVPDGSSFSDW